MQNKMLNLEVGKYYEIKISTSSEPYRGKVYSKQIHDKNIHTYFVAWPNKNKNNKLPIGRMTGLYLWDRGMANQGYSMSLLLAYIIECRELNPDEIKKIEALGALYLSNG